MKVKKQKKPAVKGVKQMECIYARLYNTIYTDNNTYGSERDRFSSSCLEGTEGKKRQAVSWLTYHLSLI